MTSRNLEVVEHVTKPRDDPWETEDRAYFRPRWMVGEVIDGGGWSYEC